ncbi:MAG: PLP-dependent aminotransferase family protein [Lachnospiraceae bacterium]|nr:PLP-dependent aminotransferase family protein [Lachnospiraceae bacterium]
MKELPIHIQLDPKSDITLYEQIYEYIRNEIKAGNLLKNEKLPSARFLAEYLQVSRTTVDMAYEQLVLEGYVEARARRGYFVSAFEELYALGETANAKTYKPKQSERQPAYRYDFSPNAIDMRYFPYATWKKITKSILVDANSKMFSLGESQGDLQLRTTICRYLHGSRGVNCEPEQIIIGAGNDYLLLLLEKILGRHIHVAMENPTYVRAYKIFQSCAYPVSFVPMDESGMRVDCLRQTDAQAAYVMPSHQYPTGVSMPIGRRMELLKWASEEQERYLIEDDYDSEFRYKGKPLPSLQASDADGRVVYIGTFSKAIAPAIRISYMVLPYPLLERYRSRCSFYSSTVSRIDQTILNEFIRDGYFERYLNKMRKLYREKHDLILNELKPFEKDFRISGSNAGLHIILTDRKHREEEELARMAADVKVKIYRMQDFRMKNSESNALGAGSCDSGQTDEPAMLILGYGALTPEEIREGIALLKEVWN